MSKPFVTNAAGDFLLAGKTGQGSLFKKEVIRKGEYQHPVTPWPDPLTADEAYLSQVAENTNEALSRGIEVPVPDTHSDKPGDNKGYVRRVYVEDVEENGLAVPALFADVEIIDADTIPKVGETIRRVSGWFTPHGDGEWSPSEGDRLRHVSLTNYPVASRQGNFVALSGNGEVSSEEIKASVLVRETPRPGEDTMKFTETQIAAAKALGIELPEDGTVSEAALDALIAKATAEPPKPEMPMGIEAAGQALSLTAKDTYFSRYRGERDKNLDVEVTQAKASGRLNEAGAQAFRALIGTDHAFALSDEGTAVESDVAKAARDLIASLPEKASVPVGEGVTGDPVTPPAANTDDDKPDPKALAQDALKAAGMKLE